MTSDQAAQDSELSLAAHADPTPAESGAQPLNSSLRELWHSVPVRWSGHVPARRTAEIEDVHDQVPG